MALIKIVYCGICTLPPEYCSFNSNTISSKCKIWLQANSSELFAKLYPDDAIKAVISNDKSNENSFEEDMAAVKLQDADKLVAPPVASAPEEPTNQQNKKKTAKKNVIKIKTTQRNKRKSITVVLGLELFDVDLKKAAKLFAGKFACGASVSKNASGFDEIVIQGDVQDQLVKLVMDTWKVSKDCFVLED